MTEKPTPAPKKDDGLFSATNPSDGLAPGARAYKAANDKANAEFEKTNRLPPGVHYAPHQDPHEIHGSHYPHMPRGHRHRQ